MPMRSSIASQVTFVGMTGEVLNSTMLECGVKASFRKHVNSGLEAYPKVEPSTQLKEKNTIE
jgi:hypothetical protein